MQGKNIIILGVIILVAGIFMYFLGGEITRNAYNNAIFSAFSGSQSYDIYKTINTISQIGGAISFSGIILACSSFFVMLAGVIRLDKMGIKNDVQKVETIIDENKFCYHCGSELKTTSKYCYMCGKQVK